MLIQVWAEREVPFDIDYYIDSEANTRKGWEYNKAWRFYTFRLVLKI